MERPTTKHRLNDFCLTMARRSFGELGVSDSTVVNMRRVYCAALSGHSPFAEFLQQVEGWIKSGLSTN